MSLEWIGGVVGGVGLFLLGVRLMTDGLRAAAGRALGRILARATKSRLRALAAGFGLTALVQSSSAVTVAAIGFVNAGLLGLSEALWVVFGSNVGTTITGWLVAATGVDLKIDALALPMIGCGALARMLGKGRVGAIGEAIAGLGLFFLGVVFLKDAFSTLAAGIELDELAPGVLGRLALFGVGALLTILMQSSSAAMAITLSAASAGIIDLDGAGIMVIGANVGTTSTALFATLDATPAARRTAAGHVVFNLLAAVVALALLPWMLRLVQIAITPPDNEGGIATTLAVFHTVFNLLGVVLIWPLSGHLERALAKRWVTPLEERGIPRHLDRTVAAVPEVALQAALREAERMLRHAGDIVGAALRKKTADKKTVEEGIAAYERLGAAVSSFIADLSRARLSAEASTDLEALLRARRHADTAVEQARLLVEQRSELADVDKRVAALDDELATAFRELVAASNPEAEHAETAEESVALGRMQERYEQRRSALLAAATAGGDVQAAIDAQHFLAECRRAVRHLARGARELAALRIRVTSATPRVSSAA
ncbi:MAG: Na/Pi symporter [Sandaracinaceae bacterium]|nr:Na/Pi symporter [Sandaracinaceae bacterium]